MLSHKVDVKKRLYLILIPTPHPMKTDLVGMRPWDLSVSVCLPEAERVENSVLVLTGQGVDSGSRLVTPLAIQESGIMEELLCPGVLWKR